ncbi:MAG: CRISPR system precrRNA processing endoribonuclease RAMP protein Cas6 [Phycisphaerae bacterium]
MPEGEAPVPLPEYPGKTLRGALGRSLKDVVCHGRRADCSQCVLRERCAYSVAFEGFPPFGRTMMRKYQRIPQPLVLQPPGTGDVPTADDLMLRFGVRLFGPAAAMYPYVIYAVERMLDRGLGAQRVPIPLREVSDGEKVIYRKGDDTIRPPAQNVLSVDDSTSPGPSEVQVECVSPLRLQVRGREAREFDLAALLRAVVRRVRLLGAFYGDGDEVETPSAVLNAAAKARALRNDIRLHRVSRYSGRQKRRMTFHGLVGRIAYEWPDREAGPQPWLEAASILHVGKATTFGFGQIRYWVEAR